MKDRTRFTGRFAIIGNREVQKSMRVIAVAVTVIVVRDIESSHGIFWQISGEGIQVGA
jgi:hypothetical protein